jgi:hypothetical protein
MQKCLHRQEGLLLEHLLEWLPATTKKWRAVNSER